MLFTVDGAKCGFWVCVNREFRSAASGDEKDFLFVLSQMGRADNPALLIFTLPAS
jgi:hypothetical protein